MWNPHLFLRIKRALGKTKNVEIKPSDLEDKGFGEIFAKGSAEKGVISVAVGGRVIRCERPEAYEELKVGQRVRVAQRDMHSVIYDYRGGDFSKKVEVSRSYVGKETFVSPVSQNVFYYSL